MSDERNQRNLDYVNAARDAVFTASTVTTGKTTRNVSAAAKASVALHLAAHADGDGVAWPSQETLAAKTGHGVALVNRTLQALEADGVLKREARHRRTGERSSDAVTVNLGALRALAPTETTAPEDKWSTAPEDKWSTAPEDKVRDQYGRDHSEGTTNQPANARDIRASEPTIGRLASTVKRMNREWDEEAGGALSQRVASRLLTDLDAGRDSEELDRLFPRDRDHEITDLRGRLLDLTGYIGGETAEQSEVRRRRGAAEAEQIRHRLRELDALTEERTAFA
jgi:Helix-turn-helix domain